MLSGVKNGHVISVRHGYHVPQRIWNFVEASDLYCTTCHRRLL